MQLNELFDKPYPYKWVQRDDEMWKAEAKLADGGYLTVNFNPVNYQGTEWEINFQRDDAEDFKATGTGDEFKVFSTVMSAFNKWYEWHVKNGQAPEAIEFDAAKDEAVASSRAKLYTRFAKKFANKSKMDLTVKDSSNQVTFLLKRPQKANESEPPLLHRKARKNSDPHTLDNLGLAEKEAEIEKPHPSDTLGVKRSDMPQVHRDHYPELLRYLKEHGASIKKGEMSAKQLKATQSEFSDEGVRKMIKKGGVTSDGTKKPLLVSSDNYIIDGHHRWLAAWQTDDVVPVLKFSIPVAKLLQLVRDFKHTTYKDIYENISVTGTAHSQEEKRRKLVPGTKAWFKHWFSRPYLTREDVERLKEEAINHIKGVRNEKENRRQRSNRNRGANERGRNG